MSAGPVLRVSRRVSAPAERVFDAWLDPVWIGRFMFGPHLRSERVVSLTNEPRVGGTFHYRVERQGTEIDHTGTYREIERPRRLVFTWGVDAEEGDQSLVTIEITPYDNACELSLTHRIHPDWAEYVDRAEAGWTRILDDLANALA
jgi:uncharacterized protein YndB with AHSA1/START domain